MGFWDDLLQEGEDLLEDGKRLVGEVVDGGSELVADGLDAIGAEGVADNVRDWGDSVADQLGATPDEKKLGETEDPKELIHGEPGVMRDRAGKLDGLSTNFTTAADGLSGINVGEFQGEAADAYHQKIGQEIPKWRDAASATKSAASALNAFAPIVEAAQQRAAEAIAKWKEGLRQHDQWVKACNAYDDAVANNADPLPPQPPDEDPGKKLCDEAVQILNDARKSRNEGASTAASAFNNAANEAPPMPPPSQRLAANFEDFKNTADMFTGHAVVGLVGAVTDLGKLIRTVDPTNPYNIAHPADYAKNATAVGAGLTDMAAHPDKLIKGFIGDGWGKDPGQAFGTLMSNFIPMGPKGTGVFKSVLKDAVSGGSRDAGRTAANAAAHAPSPPVHTSPHTSPGQATPTTHTTPHDGAPATSTRDTTATPTESHTPAADHPRSEQPAPHSEAPSESPRPDSSPHDSSPPAEQPRPVDPPAAENPRPHDSTPAERQDPADQPTVTDHSPGGEHRPETPAGDRTPDSNTPSGHDRTPDSPNQHGDGPESPRRDPDNGPDPEPRQERVPDESPNVRDHQGDSPQRPADHDSPPHDRTTEHEPNRTDAPSDKPTDRAPVDRTEPASTPHDAPHKTENPAVRDESPQPARSDSTPNTGSAAPHTNSPSPHSPVNPARVEPNTPHHAPKDAGPPPPREVPAAKEPAPKPDIPERAKPSPAAAADNALRPAAAAAKDVAKPEGAKPVEPIAVMDRGPGHPGGGERMSPNKTDGPGDRGGNGRDGNGRDGTDGEDPIDGDTLDNQDIANKSEHDPNASTEPDQKSSKDTDPVDIATGEYYLPAVDVDLPAVLGLRLTRTHKSGYRAGVWLGPSWSCSFDARVVVTEHSVTTIDADGTMFSFEPPTGDEPSVARRGRPWRLWSTPTGGYRLEPPHGGVAYHFAPKPHLGGADTAAGVIYISAITDAHQNRILFTYDDSGAPSGVVHSGGYRIGVDCDGRRIRGYTLATDTETTPLSQFGYTRGDLTSVTDATGATTQFEYDDDHRMVAWTDSNGAHYVNEYDDTGRVIYQGGHDGVWASSFNYQENPDGTGTTTVHTDAVGAHRVYGFDNDLRPRAVADPAGRIVRTDFNADRDPLQITDPTGATTTLRYTPDGMPAQITDPLGQVTTIRYVDTPAGPRPAEVTAPDGAITSFGYDESGNRVHMREPAGGVWRWIYTASGAVAARIDPLGRRTDYHTNSAGLPVRVIDPSGAETVCTYDDFGNLTEIVSPDGGTTRLSYDRAGRLTSRTSPDGSSETWTYDGEGNRTSYTNAVGATTRWEYGFYDMPIARVDADGSRTHFSYDKARRLIAVTNPAGLTWSYRYNPDGMLAAQTDFNGATTAYTYDAAGRLASRTNAAGQTLTYSYDATGRLVSESSSGGDFSGERIEYAYDAAGRMLTAVMPWAQVEFGYDLSGRVVSESVDGRAVQSVYNSAGDLTEVFTPSGLRTSLSYDRRGLVDMLTAAGQRCEITSDELGRATRLQFGTTAIDSAFDADGRLRQRRVLAGLRDLSVLNLGTGSGSAERLLAGAAYSYRSDDTLAAVAAADPTAPTLGTAATYGTDVMGRLVSRQAAGSIVESTVFDAAQNLTVGEGPAPSSRWRYDGVRLIDDGRSRYHYDAAGRLIQTITKRLGRKPDVWHYQWDAWDRLRAVTTPDGQQFSYTYDPAGRRLSKTSEHSRILFFWNGTQLVEQTSSAAGAEADVMSWSYLPGRFTPHSQIHSSGGESDGAGLRAGELSLDGPAAVAPQQEIDRQFYALVTDHIETPVALLDPASGALAGQAHATMWGQTTWTGVDTPWRYPGQYHDPETGLHYNHHRYYQPGTGRYLSPDPLGLAPAPNPYGYPENPTTWADPWGLAPYNARPESADQIEFPPSSHGYGVNDPPVRLYGPWTQEDLARMMNGAPPRSYGFPHLHHADQMPGSAIHEVPQDIHRRPELHPNKFNQGVSSEMREADRKLHWMMRASEMGWRRDG
ncbi:putative T7SS-secreted protein [Mycolicibacterium mageritense]|uniref:putative T7SS-secreted protein n=1 Tax=Mycolicibacterium mageritense TaxID=53462 RepID=UPI001E472F77|nr:RHS repeat-associated core domain-containing protein [Mycolicibacterium mageritense]GJJ22104.1 hypothetical protein MTY414_57770 [Mycolicibacterium mageritense]